MRNKASSKTFADIQVDIWRTIKLVKKDIFKPSLYLIFANHTAVDKKESKGDKKDNMVLMEEVLEFAKKTKLPCHVVGQRVLFHSGSSHAVFIHYKTEKDTVKELVEKGFHKFERGDMDTKNKKDEMDAENKEDEIDAENKENEMDAENKEDEIQYFLRMAKYVSGEAVLPVVISLRNGGMTKEVLTYTEKSKIPIIRLKICTDERTHNRYKNPWSIKTSKTKDYPLGKYDGEDDPDEIALISEIQSDFRDNLDALVCSLLIGERKQLELKVSTSELYGLILYALLKKQYWDGAQQLIETGCIRIRYILIGCVILEDEISNWRTNSCLKEKLQRFKSAITQRAIRITSCINEADKKKKDVSAKIKESKFHSPKKDSENKEEQQLGEHIKHAGRLLVNHGYIEDAIKTQNKTFLDNSTVRNILNEMWYGTEKLDKRTSVCFFGLAVVHMIVLPLLMISMEAGPLIWFYKKYNLPFIKVSMQMLIVSMIRKKWKSYASDCWNQLDWLSMIVYASGMLMKLCQGPQCRDASKVLLVAAFIFLSIRILNLFCMSAMLGPKLVMIRKMARDTVSFMIILAVIMMCYNISFYALLYPNSELSWLQIEMIIQNGYWMLFGELNLDSVTLSEPHCTFNRAVYENTDVPRCPAKLGVYLTPYLKALYGLIAVILLLNLLIAMYSDTFQKVQKESEFYWAQIQTDFLEEYSIKTVFPVHLQLLVLPATIVHAIFWLSCPHLCGKLYKIYRDQGYGKEDTVTLNHCPMFVRVFWYNTNFDLKLKTTKEAEGNGALKAKG
ncbi:TRPM3 [Mytilus edulis]|uniref:TRPM3 n=1 Tax=Mytilus edulis TaxID=6550 RepID=A0A8S3VHH9_MYTED|nr:TRPM3 [Mytilus edulis]